MEALSKKAGHLRNDKQEDHDSNKDNISEALAC